MNSTWSVMGQIALTCMYWEVRPGVEGRREALVTRKEGDSRQECTWGQDSTMVSASYLQLVSRSNPSVARVGFCKPKKYIRATLKSSIAKLVHKI